MKFFFHTQHSRANGLLLFVCSAVFFPVIVSCDDQTAQNAEELVSEAKEEMTSTTDEMVALTEESMNTAKEVVDETAESLSSTQQTQTEQVVAEAETAVTEENSASDDTAAASGGDKPYTVSADGKVDWYTFNGFRRYHSECHVCHGPAGLGSSFAPNLTESVTRLGYEGYLEVVVNGRTTVSNVENKNMPSFAANMNVMCYIDDIYAYLVARADGVVGTERPDKEAKPEAAKERDDSCSAG